MFHARLVTAWVAARYLVLRQRVNARSDRGDVPGWVMVTVMTAALVVAILAVFKGKIVSAVNDAIDQVTQAN
jgi:hypothetical protein